MKKAGVVILAIVLALVIGVELFLFLEMKNLAGERGFSGIVQMLSGGERSGESAGTPITESPAMTPEPPDGGLVLQRQLQRRPMPHITAEGTVVT